MFFDRIKVDDPVGATAVHLACGVFGTICVGLFAKGGVTSLSSKNGLFYGGGFELLGVQLLGIVAVGAFVFASSFLVWYLIKKTLGIRVSTDVAIPVVRKDKDHSGDKITKVTIIANQTKLSKLQATLEKLGITGLTVTNVMGHGMQKGNPTYFRGEAVDTKLLPKVKIDVVICN